MIINYKNKYKKYKTKYLNLKGGASTSNEVLETKPFGLNSIPLVNIETICTFFENSKSLSELLSYDLAKLNIIASLCENYQQLRNGIQINRIDKIIIDINNIKFKTLLIGKDDTAKTALLNIFLNISTIEYILKEVEHILTIEYIIQCLEMSEAQGLEMSEAQGLKMQKLNLKITSITFDNSFNTSLGEHLSTFTNLKSLTFGDRFDQLLGTSLNKLTELKSLTFGMLFDQLLGTSLDELTNLKSLTFGYHFNKELGNSLDKLTNLQSLTFGYHFNNNSQLLNKSIHKLSKLRSLIFGERFDINKNSFTVNCLDGLTSLQNLNFGYNFNRTLSTSLNFLISLKNLTFGNYFNNGNNPLGESLNHLQNLESLTFGNDFYNKVPRELDIISRIEKLLENFKLRKLKKLTFGNNFFYNKSLQSSLDLEPDLSLTKKNIYDLFKEKLPKLNYIVYKISSPEIIISNE